MSQTLGEKSLGEIVQLKEDGIAKSYIIVHQGTPNSTKYINADGTWLLRLEAEDQVRTYGQTCDFSSSTLVTYLNDDYVGALSKFEDSAIAAMKIVTIPYEPNNSEVVIGTNGVSCKIFVLNLSEMNVSYGNRITETELDYFNVSSDTLAQERRIALRPDGYTATCWSRTPSGFTSSVMCWVTSATSNMGVNTGYSTTYARYAFVLPSETPVSASSFVFSNTAPTTTSGLLYSTSVRARADYVAKWGASTDVDDNLEGYEVEISVDGGDWNQVYKGAGEEESAYVSCTFTAPTTGSFFAWRVRAYDSEGATSSYTETTNSVTIIYNTPPSISDSDQDLGQFSTSFTRKYTVKDNEGGSLEIVEAVDGITINSFSELLTGNVGKEYTVTFAADQWARIGNGDHALTIKATDSYGESAERNYTFTKLETEIHLQYLEPLETEKPVVLGILTVDKFIAEGASFSVEVCNNALDESPTWENVTSAVNLGGRFYLNNNSKKAAKWGFNVRVMVKREAATEDSWISQVSGYFREG